MRRALSPLIATWQRASQRQASLLAAGVAFYLFTSLFPAMIAVVSLYGLVASPQTVARQSARIADLLPADAASIINGELESLAAAPSTSLGLGAVIAIAAAAYSASSGVGNLVVAINAMFDLRDSRSFIHKKLLSLGLTVGALLFGVVLIGFVAVLPAALNAVEAVPGVRVAIQFGRWAVVLLALMGSIGILYRVAPDHEIRTRFVSSGVLVATAVWLLASVGFSFYVDRFGNYAATYGALAGVVVLLLWLWVGVLALLLGAAFEANLHQSDTPDTPDRTPV